MSNLSNLPPTSAVDSDGAMFSSDSSLSSENVSLINDNGDVVGVGAGAGDNAGADGEVIEVPNPTSSASTVNTTEEIQDVVMDEACPGDINVFGAAVSSIDNFNDMQRHADVLKADHCNDYSP